MDICIDFDGTCVKHRFPKVGEDIGAVPVLKELIANGHRLILFTMRSNVVNAKSPENNKEYTGNFLDDAVKWFKDNGIELFGINNNPDQNSWTTSPKAYGHMYIDDASLVIPLLFDPEQNARPYVNWYMVRGILIREGYIKEE